MRIYSLPFGLFTPSIGASNSKSYRADYLRFLQVCYLYWSGHKQHEGWTSLAESQL